MRRIDTATALNYIGPLVTLGIVLCLWVYAVDVAKVSVTLLPHPSSALQALVENFRTGAIYPHLWATLQAAFLGLLFGSLIGIGLAGIMAVVRPVERSCMLYLVAFQSIPKAALAPLIFLWCGFGLTSTVVLSTLACLYPIFANAFAGFRSADTNLYDLYRACGSSRWRIFWSVQVPAALGPIMVGLEISVVFALIATVVMEFVAGAVGLGTMIQSAASTYDTATVFAAVFLLAFIGITSSALIRFARRKIVFWEGDAGSTTTVKG
jgi:NitT/TauT family transport system permease protein